MQNQPNLKFLVNFIKAEVSQTFPVTNPGKDRHSPSDQPTHSLHFHNLLELGYCYKGSGIFFVDNKVLPFSEGDVSVIFANEAHLAQSHKNMLSEWKFFDVDIESLLTDIGIQNLAPISKMFTHRGNFQNIISSKEHTDITQLVYQIILELENGQNNYENVIRGLMWALALKLNRLILNSDEVFDRELSSKNLNMIAPVLSYISENYNSLISVKQLSNICHMSITHFRRIFHAAVGTSPLEYIIQVRIKMAIILLHDSKNTITFVATEIGYSTTTSFCRHFKRLLGVSPSSWRKRK